MSPMNKVSQFSLKYANQPRCNFQRLVSVHISGHSWGMNAKNAKNDLWPKMYYGFNKAFDTFTKQQRFEGEKNGRQTRNVGKH